MTDRFIGTPAIVGHVDLTDEDRRRRARTARVAARKAREVFGRAPATVPFEEEVGGGHWVTLRDGRRVFIRDKDAPPTAAPGTSELRGRIEHVPGATEGPVDTEIIAPGDPGYLPINDPADTEALREAVKAGELGPLVPERIAAGELSEDEDHGYMIWNTGARDAGYMNAAMRGEMAPDSSGYDFYMARNAGLRSLIDRSRVPGGFTIHRGVDPAEGGTDLFNAPVGGVFEDRGFQSWTRARSIAVAYAGTGAAGKPVGVMLRTVTDPEIPTLARGYSLADVMMNPSRWVVTRKTLYTGNQVNRQPYDLLVVDVAPEAAFQRRKPE